MSNSHFTVVPAKRSASRDPYAALPVLRDVVRPFCATIEACGYGSLRAQGRQYWVNTPPHPRDANAPGLCCIVPPEEGVGNAGCSAAPAASRGKDKNHTSVVTTGPPISPGIPAREWF